MRNIIGLSLVGLLAASTSGCELYRNKTADAISYTEAHPISVDTQTVTLTLSPSATGELSSLDTAKIRSFASTYLAKGHGPISFTSPNELRGEEPTFEAQVFQVFHDVGMRKDDILRTAYARTIEGGNAYVLSFTQYVATPSACGVWQGIRRNDYKNIRSPNFGCATQNNLAAMVVDPRDLIIPADQSAPDSAIRIRGVRAFRQGEDTATQRNENISVEVAE
ncbi:MAG: CpaD family pilus assembly lipoprotein [Pseudomonadota bacterium]